MKSKYILFTIGFIFCIFGHAFIASAVDVPVGTASVGDVTNQPLLANNPSVVDVTLTRAVIKDTTASFIFSVKAKKAVTYTLLMGYGTDPSDIPLVNGHVNQRNMTVIDSDNLPVVGQTQTVQFPPSFSGLTPGTNYFFQIKDTVNNAVYQKVYFTTTGAGPDNPLIVAQKADKGSLTVTTTVPVSTAAGSNVNGVYNVKFSGVIKSVKDMNAGLDFYIGDSVDSLLRAGTILPIKTLRSGSQESYTYTQTGLAAGTTYYYRIREVTGDFWATEALPFITGGAVSTPVTLTPYDPNAVGAGALIPNYIFPTNIGEPTGEIAAPIVDDQKPLVPCGKRSDIGTKDERCTFRHIIILAGNVIRFLLILLIPITVLMCVSTGVQMILHRKVPEDLVKYKGRLLKVGGGLVLMLLAWTIVATILKSLLGDEASKYLLLKIL